MSTTIDRPVQIEVTAGGQLWCTRGNHQVENYKCYAVNGQLVCEDHVRWIWWPSGEEIAPARLPVDQHRRTAHV